MMSGITLQQAQINLAKWLEADQKVAEAQSYTMQTANGSRTLTRADAGKIQERIKYWDQKVQELSVPGGRRFRSFNIVG